MSDSIESPMTFYRIDPDAPITEDTLVAIDQHSGGQRALVPVEGPAYRIDKDQAWEHWKRNTFEFLEESGVVVEIGGADAEPL